MKKRLLRKDSLRGYLDVMKGRIVAISCGTYSIMSEGKLYDTSARGIFRKNKQKPLVGDIVEFNEKEFVINSIEERFSYLKRPPIANIDQILLVFSLSEPAFSYYLVCKYLTYVNYMGIKSYLILTKSDVDNEKEGQSIIDNFAKVGVKTFLVSNKTKEGLDEVKKLFLDKTTCLIGQTGVGKSSLLNAIDPKYKREVGEYSEALGRGKHQTKEVALLPYQGGFLADTPGFSSLELDIKEKEVSHYFPGMENEYVNCYFPDCMHISEGRCKIKEMVKEGIIPSIMYECYLKLIKEIKER